MPLSLCGGLILLVWWCGMCHQLLLQLPWQVRMQFTLLRVGATAIQQDASLEQLHPFC
jgi:hypothetical protein